MLHTKFQSYLKPKDQKHTACTAAQDTVLIKHGSCLTQARRPNRVTTEWLRLEETFNDHLVIES